MEDALTEILGIIGKIRNTTRSGMDVENFTADVLCTAASAHEICRDTEIGETGMPGIHDPFGVASDTTARRHTSGDSTQTNQHSFSCTAAALHMHTRGQSKPRMVMGGVDGSFLPQSKQTVRHTTCSATITIVAVFSYLSRGVYELICR